MSYCNITQYESGVEVEKGIGIMQCDDSSFLSATALDLGTGPNLTDGIGTPDPNPKHLVNWCFEYNLVNIICV